MMIYDDLINITVANDTLSAIDKLACKWRTLYPKDEQMRLAQQSYDEDFLVRMAYNSNAIEGSTLTLSETEIIYEGEFVAGKPGREQIAARGIFEGAVFVDEMIRNGAPLDEVHLRDLHEQCALDLQPASRGTYRSAPAVIRASRTTPTAPIKIRDEMKDLFYRLAYTAHEIHPLIYIPWFHACLESIHPFADGNGRTGRLWMNAQLRKCAYPPICIKVDNGTQYKTSLETWQVDNDSAPFLSLFLSCIQSELENRITYLSQGIDKQINTEKNIADEEEVLGIIYYQPTISASSIGHIIHKSERQVQRTLKQLAEKKLLKREGAPKNGRWVVLE